MRMMLRAGFDTYTGYGNDGVDMAVWLERAGVDVVPWPANLMPGLPTRFTDLLTKDPGGHYDVAMTFCPPFDLHPEDVAGLADTAVGWTMWERTPLTPADMAGHGWGRRSRRTHWWSKPTPNARRHEADTNPRKKDWLDLLVVTCHDNVEAFRALDPTVPMEVVPNGIDPERFPVLDRQGADRPFTFASVGMLSGRKDPFATLEAWRLAHEMDPTFDARLILKTACPGLHPRLADVYPNLVVITSAWPPAKVLDLYGQTDVLVSTSRGEGNNKPNMEFMSTGGPIMATDWSGHRNYLHPETGYPLPGRLVDNADGTWRDFRVDIEATAETFLHCWRHPDEVRRKGEIAAQQIRATLSWEKVIDRLLRVIGQVR